MTNTLPRFASSDKPACTLAELTTELVTRGMPKADQPTPGTDKEWALHPPFSWSVEHWEEPIVQMFGEDGYCKDQETAGQVWVVLPDDLWLYIHFNKEEQLLATEVFHEILRFKLAATGWLGWPKTEELVTFARQWFQKYEQHLCPSNSI